MGEDTHASICWWVAILVHGNRSGGCTGTSTAVGSYPVDSLAVFHSPSRAASCLLSRQKQWPTPAPSLPTRHSAAPVQPLSAPGASPEPGGRAAERGGPSHNGGGRSGERQGKRGAKVRCRRRGNGSSLPFVSRLFGGVRSEEDVVSPGYSIAKGTKD